MLQLVEVGKRSIGQYKPVVGDEIIEKLHNIAKDLKGARVVQLNSTTYGGGVSELLRSIVPLENDLGLDVEWRVVSGDEYFYRVTKTIHNALQGGAQELTSADKDIYLAHNTRYAQLLGKDYDFVIVHDPQPAAIRTFKKDNNAKWIWRCHIDTSQPNEEIWNFIRPFVSAFDKKVFTMKEFIPPGISIDDAEIISPAIDPLSPKNFPIDHNLANNILDWIGIPANSKLIVQVSRFDSWKDPLGVIEVYRLIKEEIPDVQLALIGSMALDDPEGWDMYSKILKEDQNDPQLYCFTNLTGVSNIEVNAFQRLADVVIQKSIREGFGLVVSEALWKGTSVVAGRAGGIPMQLAQGGGYLVDSIEECAEKTVHLLNKPDEAKRIGLEGQEFVRKNFLLTRLIYEELSLLRNLL